MARDGDLIRSSVKGEAASRITQGATRMFTWPSWDIEVAPSRESHTLSDFYLLLQLPVRLCYRFQAPVGRYIGRPADNMEVELPIMQANILWLSCLLPPPFGDDLARGLFHNDEF